MKFTRGMLLGAISIGLVGVTAHLQSRLLENLTVLHKPKLVLSHPDRHMQYMQMSKFKGQPVAVKYNDEKYVCRRPKYRVLWRGKIDETNPMGGQPFLISDIKKNGCPAQGSKKISDGAGWFDFGQRFSINNELDLTRLDGINDSRPSLVYSDATPILYSYTLSIRRSSKSKSDDIQRNTRDIQLNTRSTNKCALHFEGGTLTDCNSRESPGLVDLTTPEDGKNSRAVTIGAIMPSENENAVVFFAKNNNWHGIAGKIAVDDKGISIPCPDGKLGTKVRQISIKNRSLDIQISCQRREREPGTEVERLAKSVYSDGKPLPANESTIKTTLDRNLDFELNKTGPTDGECATVGHIGLCSGMELVVMNSLNGHILGMASKRQPNNPFKLGITNFELKSPGSVAKIPFTSAALESTRDNANGGRSPLQDLMLHGASPDGYKGGNGQSCRIGTGVIPGCDDADGDSKKFKGAYFTTADGGNTADRDNYDLTRFLVKSENQYAVTLLYLASSEPLQKEASCNHAFPFFRRTPYKPGWSLSLGDSNPQGLNRWLEQRTPEFNDSDDLSCNTDDKIGWLEYMGSAMHIWSTGTSLKRHYLWESEPTDDASSKIGNALIDITPDTETFGFNRNNVGGTKIKNGYVESQIYKLPIGGGDGVWSNIGIAEAISTVVSGTEQKASLVERTSAPRRNSVSTPAQRAIVSAMHQTVWDKEGTAHRLCRPPVVCAGNSATLRVDGYGTLEILAKTGTPRARASAGSSRRRKTSKSNGDITQLFDSWINHDDIESLCDEFDGNTCALTAKGAQRYKMICASLLASRENDLVKDYKPATCNDFGSALASEYKQWLAHRFLAGTKEGIDSDESDSSEKRLVVVLRNIGHSGRPPAACTLYLTYYKATGGLAEPVRSRIQTEETFAYMHRLIQSKHVLNACGFKEASESF